MRDTSTCFPKLTILYLVANCLYFHAEWRKARHFGCKDCRFVCFETGLGKPILTLNDPSGFKNTTNVHSIHLEPRMTLPCQSSAGKWKYIDPCLDFLGIPDQRTAYVKRQVRPGWTFVRRSSVTADLLKSMWRFRFRFDGFECKHRWCNQDVSMTFRCYGSHS